MPRIPSARAACLAAAVLVPACVSGQNASVDSGPRKVITLATFLDAVDRSNPDYAAQRAAVDVADAQRSVARVFPNSSFSFGYARDISGQQQASTANPGLSQTVLLGGKIGARGAVADQSYQQSVAQLHDFARTLRGSAASAYIDALVSEMAADRRRRSAEAVDRLAAGDEARFKAGDIAEADMLQSRVERLRFRADYLAAEAAHQTALLALSLFMGKRNNDTVFVPAPYASVSPKFRPVAGPASVAVQTL